jgi:ubiquitin thioesterase protein OTUB1
MYRESDHIHIIALTNAFNTPVGIIYLDRTDQDKVTVHNFPEDCPNSGINILYRPGHYDIIYKD